MKQEANASPVHAQLLEAAADWFIDFRLGDADAQVRKDFAAWLRQSPQHIRAYLQIAELYSDSLALKGRLQFDIEQIAARAREESNVVALPSLDASHPQLSERLPPVPPAHARPAAARSFTGMKRPWFAVAVTTVVLMAMASIWYLGHRPATFESAIGEQHVVVLEDGSRVTLDARSRIRVSLSRSARDVDLLSGQALFDVAHDPARPFTVHGSNVVVRAVGTQFDVIQRANAATVTVIQGRVEVRQTAPGPDLPHVLVSAGEQVVVSASSGVQRPVLADVGNATSWTQKRLVFESEPLAQVVEDFNRHNARQLVLANAALGQLLVTGTFSSNQPDSFVRFLRSQPGVVVEDTGPQITIDRR
jgi:transmembrane sensor